MRRVASSRKAVEVGLAPLVAHRDGGTVHDVTHPQLAGAGEGEAPSVLAGGFGGGLAHQVRAAQQPVHGGAWWGLGAQAALDGGADEDRDGQLRGLLLEADQGVGEQRGQRPGLAAVGARLRQQRIEAATAVGLEPIAQGLGGHPGAGAAGDGVGEPCLALEPGIQPGAVGRQLGELGDQAVAEQGHGLGGRC